MNSENLEMLLQEILLEQKQVNEKLSSFTRILMEVNEITGSANSKEEIEKLSERARMIQMACGSIPEQLSLPLKEIRQLTHALGYYHDQLKIPLTQKVVHHIHKIWIAAVTCFIVDIILAYWLWNVLHR